MRIGEVIEHLDQGQRCAREGWNGKGQHIALQKPDEHSANTLPYIYIVTVQGDRVPWVCSQTDLLASDWMVLAACDHDYENPAGSPPEYWVRVVGKDEAREYRYCRKCHGTEERAV